jgi:hypothetical protein
VEWRPSPGTGSVTKQALERHARVYLCREAPPAKPRKWNWFARNCNSSFGRKQEEAITALLTQRNVEEAAPAAGSTLERCSDQ